MIRKNGALCLAPEGDRYWAARVSRGDEKPYRVDWLEPAPAEALVGAENWRDVARHLKQTLLLLPSESCTLVQARIPVMKAPEITQALSGTIMKLKGGALEHWLIDHHRRPADPDAPATVVPPVSGLCLELPHLMPIIEPLDALDARPAQALPAALALDSLLREEQARDEEGVGNWNLVYVGREERFLVIGDEHGPKLLRNLPQNLSEGGDPSEYAERLITEVDRSTFFAQQDDASAKVERVFVAGDPRIADPLQEKLAEGEGPEAVRWMPEQLFEVEGGTASWEYLLPMAGAAAMLEGPAYNVMPKIAGKSRGRTVARYALYAGATLCLGLLPLLGGGTYSTEQVQGRTLNQQGNQLLESRRLAEETALAYLRNQSLLERQELLELHGESRTDLSAALRDLVSRMPGSVQLDAMEIDREPTGEYLLHMTGQSRGESAELAQSRFMEFHRALAKSPFLIGERDPITLEIAPAGNKENAGSLVGFEMEYRLREGVRG